METETNTSRLPALQTSWVLIAFALSILISLYLLITLPGALTVSGNVQNITLAMPVLTKLYISLGITALLAFAIIYLEMRNKRTVIVYKEKTKEQVIAESESKSSNNNTRNLTQLSSKGLTDNNLLGSALKLLAQEFEAVAGAGYLIKLEGDKKFAELESGFALPPMETDTLRYAAGEGLVGQVAKSGTSIYLDEIPESYSQAFSGLGQAMPRFVLLTAIHKAEQTIGVLEIATFKPITPAERQAVQKFANEIGERLN